MSFQSFLSLGLAATAAAKFLAPHKANASCRVLPEDAAWPSSSEWTSLNSTVEGRLIASVPLGAYCHDLPFNIYNETMCAEVQADYAFPSGLNLNSPPEMMSLYFQNFTCSPFTDRDVPCELGNFPSYVINVTGVSDVQAGIAFAKEHNVRLIIKNTGHDYTGRSSGKGSLSLWTHNMKSQEYIPNYSSSYYTGPAIKLGAGNEGYDAYLGANKTGHQIVGGSCPTVGIAGGYSQGGGHSMLGSLYGMGADNVLEWEVVTADGEHLVATPEQNEDLYWAMSGGGGGTYAVAISMTSRLHPGGIVGGALLEFNDTTVGNDVFWEAMSEFHTLLPAFIDAGNTFLYVFTNNAFQSWGVTMPNATIAEVDVLMKPFVDSLKSFGIEPYFVPHEAPNYYSHFDYYLGPLPYGATGYAPFYASRILPRAMVEDSTQLPQMMSGLKQASQAEAFDPIACLAVNTANKTHPDNAVNPAWRASIGVCMSPGLWNASATQEEMLERQDFCATNLTQTYVDAMPDSGSYLNEANYHQEDWQTQFWGDNYDKLLSIKQKYDPDHVFWAHVTVGSEYWYEDSEQRLCRS